MRLTADGSVTPTEATRAGVVINPTAMAADGRMVLAGTLGQGLYGGRRDGHAMENGHRGVAIAECNGIGHS